jgi:YHS domain-containing protein
MQELSRHFENAKLMELDAERDLHALCEFSHTSRYPAKVTVDIALLPGDDYSRVDVHFGLNIFPMLVEFQRSQESTFALDAKEEIGAWVEDRLLEFIEVYLPLQVHPLYQKDSLVTDPICDMTFPIDQAAGTLSWQGHSLYFCSNICKEAFARTHDIKPGE